MFTFSYPIPNFISTLAKKSKKVCLGNLQMDSRIYVKIQSSNSFKGNQDDKRAKLDIHYWISRYVCDKGYEYACSVTSISVQHCVTLWTVACQAP